MLVHSFRSVCFFIFCVDVNESSEKHAPARVDERLMIAEVRIGCMGDERSRQEVVVVNC